MTEKWSGYIWMSLSRVSASGSICLCRFLNPQIFESFTVYVCNIKINKIRRPQTCLRMVLSRHETMLGMWPKMITDLHMEMWCVRYRYLKGHTDNLRQQYVKSQLNHIGSWVSLHNVRIIKPNNRLSFLLSKCKPYSFAQDFRILIHSISVAFIFCFW